MSINSLLNEEVTFIKKDGRRFENVRAAVSKEKIYTADASIPIEDGDSFIRVLPSGITERYTVIDPGFYAAIGSIAAHYQSVVRKERNN